MQARHSCLFWVKLVPILIAKKLFPAQVIIIYILLIEHDLLEQSVTRPPHELSPAAADAAHAPGQRPQADQEAARNRDHEGECKWFFSLIDSLLYAR